MDSIKMYKLTDILKSLFTIVLIFTILSGVLILNGLRYGGVI